MGLFKSRGKHASNSKRDESAKPSAVNEELGDEAFEPKTAPEPEGVGALEGGESPDEALKDAPDGNQAAEPGDLEEASEPSGSETEEAAEGEGGGAETVAPIEGEQGFVAAEFPEIPKKKRRRALKAFVITLCVLLCVALAAYIAGAVVFMGRFLPNTTIGEHVISLKTDDEVAAILDETVEGYRLNIIGDGFSYEMTGKDAGLSVDTDGVLRAMHSDLNAWRWPLLIAQGSHDESSQLAIPYKRTAFERKVVTAVEEFNKTATPPVNASIVYDDKADEFVVKPEVKGTQLDEMAVIDAICDALEELEPKVTLGDEQLVQPTVLSTDEKLVEAAKLATGMVSAKLTLMLDGKSVGEVNGESLSGFISVNDRYEVTFNEEAMNAWVNELAEGFNTVGSERTYTRADGKVISVSGGVYGWEVDTEALKASILEGIKAGAVAEVEVPCSGTAAVFSGPNQRDWGNRYIDVDISEQHVRFYGESGMIIWEADCISGAPDGKHDTGRGVWCVNAKESPSKLIGYENGKKIYETSVKFWMPFEGNGIGFHDATWQPSFGGSMYSQGYGSHGCVNLSYKDAESLYGIIDWGDVVVVHD